MTKKTKKTPKKKPTINPESADQLWHALFAITHAVEQLDYAVQVNQYRNDKLDVGAWEYARLTLEGTREDVTVN
jgi:hypothetical protein